MKLSGEGHAGMSQKRHDEPRAKKMTKGISDLSEPIREVWIHGEAFAASRLSMMRIMARRMNAATVVA